MGKSVQRVSFSQAKHLLDNEKECILLDVREEEEYVTGHAENAVLFPLDTIDASTAGQVIPSLQTPVLLYCRSGRRSALAAERLADCGYERIYDLGSLVGWPYGLDWS